jgi:hypothetical protein
VKAGQRAISPHDAWLCTVIQHLFLVRFFDLLLMHQILRSDSGSSARKQRPKGVSLNVTQNLILEKKTKNAHRASVNFGEGIVIRLCTVIVDNDA